MTLAPQPHPRTRAPEPATSGPPARTDPPKRGVARRVAGFVTGLVLAAAAVYAQTFAMPVEQHNSFLTSHGTLGESVTTNRFSVKVTSVKAAHALDTKDTGGKAIRVQSSHLFLIVNVSVTTPQEPMRLSRSTPPVLLTADDRRYRPTDKVAQRIFDKWFQTGWWLPEVLIFEVPKDALPGARLVFIPPGSAIVVDSSAPEAEIDLGLSEGATARLISQAVGHHSLVAEHS